MPKRDWKGLCGNLEQRSLYYYFIGVWLFSTDNSDVGKVGQETTLIISLKSSNEVIYLVSLEKSQGAIHLLAM